MPYRDEAKLFPKSKNNNTLCPCLVQLLLVLDLVEVHVGDDGGGAGHGGQQGGLAGRGHGSAPTPTLPGRQERAGPPDQNLQARQGQVQKGIIALQNRTMHLNSTSRYTSADKSSRVRTEEGSRCTNPGERNHPNFVCPPDSPRRSSWVSLAATGGFPSGRSPGVPPGALTRRGAFSAFPV